MAQTKLDYVSFVKGRMNKSIDERLLPPGEYINAMNVRLGSTETTEIGAVENSRGNSQLTTLSFNGVNLSTTATCIGALEDGSEETLYWFVHDPEYGVSNIKLDLIVSFNTNNSVLRYHVITQSVLNFDPKFLITGVNKIENLLFFTDDKNPPRRINVNDFYSFPSGGVDGIQEEDLSVVLKPPGFEDLVTGGDTPLTAPTFTLITAAGGENYLKDRFISFAYRYRYGNGEYSATSLFSNPAFQPGNFRFDTRNYDNAGMENNFNGARINFSTGSSRVQEVDLLYKDSNTNSIYVIERFKKSDYGWGNNQQQEYVFTNSKIYTVLGSDELLRLYDNVPLIAQAQTIMGNRLMYGNYTDGFNITNENGQDIAVDYNTSLISEQINLINLPPGTFSNGVSYTINPSVTTTVPNSTATFNLTNVADKLVRGAQLTIQLRFEHSLINGTTTTTCYTENSSFQSPDISIDTTITLTSDYSSIYDLVTSADFENQIGTIEGTNFQPIATAASGFSLTDAFNSAINPPQNQCTFTSVLSSVTDSTNQQGLKISATSGSDSFSIQLLAMQFRSTDNAQTTDMYEYYQLLRATAIFTEISDKSTLHSNRDFETGIVYLDEYARASTVLVSEYNTVFIPPENSVFKNRIQSTIQNYAPSWAKKYKFVVKPSKTAYETIYTNFFYNNPFDNVTHFKLDGDNQSKVKIGDRLIVKKDADGALSSLVETTVLDIEAQSSNFLNNANELGEDSEQLAGLYMQLKVSNFNASIKEDSIIDYGEFTRGSENAPTCSFEYTVTYPLYNYTAANTTVSPPILEATQNYTIPGGSIIDIKFGFRRRANNFLNCPERRVLFDKNYVAGQDYTDFRDWWNDTNIDVADIDEFAGVNPFNGTPQGQYNSTVVQPTGSVTDPNNDLVAARGNNIECQGENFRFDINFVQAIPGQADSPLYFGFRCNGKGCSDEIFFGGGGRKMTAFVDIVVQRADSTIIFETQPRDANEDIYYDASESFDIVRDAVTGNYLHQSGGDVDTGEQNQTTSQDAIVTLDFMDSYVFGNGVESFKILDRIAARSVVMGQRALAVSNQDFKEVNRFASITYSGLYSFNSGVNNLNEFNLGLVNFKDIETSFGPIMILNARETDVLCLQEDKISIVQSGKDLLSDAVGGGAIVSTPLVLGKQIARIEEYGISFNPESFIQWGQYLYFTDTKRLAVLRLSSAGNAVSSDLTVISDTGMRSWFRDTFIEQLNTQKLGGFDPYMDEYVLSTNNFNVPIPEQVLGCGIELNLTSITTAKNFTFNFGSIVGQGTINYNVTGNATISILWNGVTTTSGVVTGSGSFTWNKTANSPQTAIITITPTGTVSATITPDCIPKVPITIIKCVINSGNDNSQTIHPEYKWADSVTVSPVDSDLAVLGTNSSVFSEYFSQTGVRSQGVFPYDGVNFSIRLNKINFDTYNWIYPSNNFKYLSSNTLYQNNATDVAALLAASTTIANSEVTNPSPNLRQATVNSLSLPIGNQYLYLIYDLRSITSQQLCYDATAVAEACCDCTFTCTAFSISSFADTSIEACTRAITNTNYHNGSSALPAPGDLVYTSSNCADDLLGTVGYASVGFYKISTSPNQYIQIGTNGLVLNVSNC